MKRPLLTLPVFLAALQESVNLFLKQARSSAELNRIIHRWIPKSQ